MRHESALRMGATLGSLVEKFSRSHAERARKRVERALGVSRDEACCIISRAYRNFGRSAVEFIRMPIMAPRLEELITLRGEEHLREAHALGRGVIFLSAHIGNWEYGAALLASRGLPMSAIGADQRDPRITNEIARLRRVGGVIPVEKGSGLRAAIDCIKRKEVLAVLLDQDARERGEVADFLGLPASTPTGPMRLALRFGTPIVPAHIVRNGDGITMTMTIEPPIEIPDDMQLAAERCNAAISRWIRETPDQWLWMYPRWATTLGDR